MAESDTIMVVEDDDATREFLADNLDGGQLRRRDRGERAAGASTCSR